MNRIKSFVVDDEEELEQKPNPKWVRFAIAVLSDLEDGKLLRPKTLADRTSVSTGRVYMFSRHPALVPFRFERGYNVIYFGNQRTVKEARSRFKVS